MPGNNYSSSPHGEPLRSANRGRRPVRVKSARANIGPTPVDVMDPPFPELTAEQLREAVVPMMTRSDLATGRGLTYEWEFFVDSVYRRIAEVAANGGGGGGGTGSQTYTYTWSLPAAQWTINHDLSAYPTVLLLDEQGQELLAELHYPDDQTVVVVHGKPYSGTAILRN